MIFAIGLAVAGRLSENPDISVAVIEAGGAKIGDPSVLTPAAFPTLLGNSEYDWNFKTIPQVSIPLAILFRLGLMRICKAGNEWYRSFVAAWKAVGRKLSH
jgi:choline dehydrogenase-like flavoprotein